MIRVPFGIRRRAFDAVVPPDVWAPDQCPDQLEPPLVEPPAATDEPAGPHLFADQCGPHPWVSHPTPRRQATGRWAAEIAEAHAEHLRSVAALPDHGAVLGPDGVQVVPEAPFVVPTLRRAFGGPA